jgi:hypothetical protein
MKRTAPRMIGLSLIALSVVLAACAGPTTTAQHPRLTPSSTGVAVGVPALNHQVVVATTGPCFVQAIGAKIGSCSLG